MGTQKLNLLDHFGLPFNGFIDPTTFTDGVGFSVKKKRTDGHASLFQVFIQKQELEKLGPLKILYIAAIYGKEIAEGISLSIENRNRRMPVDLISNDEFFYNVQTEKFFHKNREITPQDILRIIDGLHTKPSKLFKGFWIRTKLFFLRTFLASIIELNSDFLVWLLYTVSGTRASKTIWSRIVFPDRIDSEEKIREGQTKESRKISLFGYEASGHAVVFYCSFHLFLYFLSVLYNYKPQFLTPILTNGFLIVVYVIPSLWFVDAVLPKVIKSLIKSTSRWFQYVSERSIKI